MNSKTFYAIIIITLSLLVSCSKDEPDTSFEGTWIQQAIESRNCADPSDDSTKNSNFISNTPCTDNPEFLCSYEKYVFEDGAFSRSSSSVILAIPISIATAGTYSLNGSSLELCIDEGPVANECSIATIDIVGNTLILTTLEPNSGCSRITFYLKQ